MLPPTSTLTLEPTIAAPLRRQRSPLVPTFVTKLTLSIVRHGVAESW
jgi:hypothetical protein